jgi:NAD(P)-dependent dehydrogenase (short-subunit alcohol dehydrogenase family)
MAVKDEGPMNRLAGKVAIVTGGASGMGRATVMRFLAEGAKVLVADLNEANGAETLAVAKAQGHGDRIGFVRCDVAKETDVAAMVTEARRRFGRLDIAFLNAGVGGAFGADRRNQRRGLGLYVRGADAFGVPRHEARLAGDEGTG